MLIPKIFWQKALQPFCSFIFVTTYVLPCFPKAFRLLHQIILIYFYLTILYISSDDCPPFPVSLILDFRWRTGRTEPVWVRA